MLYDGATEADLAETVRQVEALDRRIYAKKADVRSLSQLEAAVKEGVAELGRLDIVSANAGIGVTPYKVEDVPEEEWLDMIDVNLNGVFRTAKVAIPHIKAGGRGGSIILTSSVGGLEGYQNAVGYIAAKHGVVGIMRTMALELAEHMIRVNSVHPTQVRTDMLTNDVTYRLYRPDLENPTIDDFAERSTEIQALPIPWVESIDISNAVLFLASDEARYVTGVALPVDAGSLIK
jgi:(+)-trans-carveol dehydrogenase/(-)-trans-carveol dehydrogenase